MGRNRNVQWDSKCSEINGSDNCLEHQVTKQIVLSCFSFDIRIIESSEYLITGRGSSNESK